MSAAIGVEAPQAAARPPLARPPADAGSRSPRRAVRLARAAATELAAVAEQASRLGLRRGGFVELLLGAARPFDGGFAPLRPLWTREALHRALAVMRLFDRLPPAARAAHGHSGHEERVARHLVGMLATLETTAASGALACSMPLRETARDLVALFGPAVGEVSIATEIVPLRLCAYRRRALVLLGHELVANALLHGFHGRRVGRLSLRLGRPAAGLASLRLCDDGIGFGAGQPHPATSVAGSLADLLEADIRYFATREWRTVAEIVFPVPRSA